MSCPSTSRSHRALRISRARRHLFQRGQPELEGYTAEKSNDPAQTGLPTPEGGYLPLEYFERKCATHGLRAERISIPDATVERVRAAQFFLIRLAWDLGGFWDSFVLYRVALAPPQPQACDG